MKTSTQYTIIKLVGIIFLLIILAGLYNYLFYDFKIYKTECHNETNSNYAYEGCVLGCATGIIGTTENFSQIDEAQYICNTICSEKLLKEVCEQKEVDEIIIIGKNVPSAQMFCPDGSERIDTCFAVIEKKDLTKEWLNENCQCVVGKCKSFEFSYTNNLKQLEGRSNYCSTDSEIAVCSEYRCGRYGVTLK